MFVKTTRSIQGDKTYVNHYIAESYWDKDKQAPRNRNLVTITHLPDEVIEKIRKALSEDTQQVSVEALEINNGDTLRGAGQLCLWRVWKKANLDQVLSGLTEKQRQSTMAMVFSRVTDPCSKRALKEDMADTFLARMFSANRLDEDTLYEVMDRLAHRFYEIQERLRKVNHSEQTRLLLYDTTSTYFEGRCADLGEYGHSKDKRWDRYQIIVGLVTDAQGMPLAVEVWPGNTHDATTINNRIEMLRDRFGFQEAVFVGDSGIYGEENIETIRENGYDYILSMVLRYQKKRLGELAPKQLNLFDHKGYYEWEQEGVRYIVCHSEAKKLRQQERRQESMQEVEEELDHLGETSGSKRYYHKLRLYNKVDNLLKEKGVRDLYRISLQRKEEVKEDTEKCLLDLEYERDDIALKERKELEGKYILETTLKQDERSPKEVEKDYKQLQKVERGFRHIKSFLKIRPIYHRLERRIRAHVLICFLAYYLVKWIEIRFREQKETREIEKIIKRWDQLELVYTSVEVEDYTIEEYNWSRGQNGEKIIKQIKKIGWWNSIQAYKHSIIKQIDEG